MQFEQVGEVIVGVAPSAKGFAGKPWRFTTFGQPVVRQVVVKNDIAHAPVRQLGWKVGVMLCHAGFKAQLPTHIRDQITPQIPKRAKDLIGKFRTAYATFPRRKLGDGCGCHTLSGELCLGGAEAFGDVFHSAAARCDMPFMRVAVDIDDARQDKVA